MGINLTSVELPTPMAVSILLLLGYVFGIMRRRDRKRLLGAQRNLAQARIAVCEMEEAVGAIQASTAEHVTRLRKLKGRMAKLAGSADAAAWQEIACEIDAILAPSLKLIGEIATAQESIRHHSIQLQQFAELQMDPLTGVGNRRFLEETVATQLDLLRRYGTPFALAIVDIDHFKELNDRQGHLYGDGALRGLTQLLTTLVRTVDRVARYGGDEFVVVLPQTDLARAGILAERLRSMAVQTLPFTVCVGVAAATVTDTPETLFERADAALYRAKSGGRNRVQCDESRDGAPVAAAAPGALPLGIAGAQEAPLSPSAPTPA